MSTRKYHATTITMAGAAAISAMLLASPHAHAAPANAGPNEDDPTFSCVLNGNHVCGPNNAMGAVPGFYINGVLAQSWPTVKNCYMLPAPHCSEDWVEPGLVHLGTISKYADVNPGKPALLNDAS